jgi:hypothetical protein
MVRFGWVLLAGLILAGVAGCHDDTSPPTAPAEPPKAGPASGGVKLPPPPPMPRRP